MSELRFEEPVGPGQSDPAKPAVVEDVPIDGVSAESVSAEGLSAELEAVAADFEAVAADFEAVAADFAEFETDLGPEELTDEDIDRLEALAAAEDAAHILGNTGDEGAADV